MYLCIYILSMNDEGVVIIMAWTQISRFSIFASQLESKFDEDVDVPQDRAPRVSPVQKRKEVARYDFNDRK